MMIEEQEGPGIPEWVVTFGDMMSLLLTFFIMLLSMSEMKQEERYQAMVIDPKQKRKTMMKTIHGMRKRQGLDSDAE